MYYGNTREAASSSIRVGHLGRVPGGDYPRPEGRTELDQRSLNRELLDCLLPFLLENICWLLYFVPGTVLNVAHTDD